MPATVPDWVLNLCTKRQNEVPTPSALELLQRASFLPPQDQQLLQLYYNSGLSQRELAELFHLHPGTVCRRLAALRRRLNDPIVAAILDAGDALAERFRTVGLARYLCHHSVARIARDLHASSIEVRLILERLRGWAAAWLAHRPHLKHNHF